MRRWRLFGAVVFFILFFSFRFIIFFNTEMNKKRRRRNNNTYDRWNRWGKTVSSERADRNCHWKWIRIVQSSIYLWALMPICPYYVMIECGWRKTEGIEYNTQIILLLFNVWHHVCVRSTNAECQTMFIGRANWAGANEWVVTDDDHWNNGYCLSHTELTALNMHCIVLGSGDEMRTNTKFMQRTHEHSIESFCARNSGTRSLLRIQYAMQ